MFRTSDEHECMARVLYFESNRSSEEGMLAVGTVVMNRVQSGKYPRSICGVVAQQGQFAPHALSAPMTGTAKVRAERVASAVMSGRRHPALKDVYFFHTANASYPRPNLQYVAIAGGNAFYKRPPRGAPYRASPNIMLASSTSYGGSRAATLQPRYALPPSTKPQTEQQWALPPATLPESPAGLPPDPPVETAGAVPLPPASPYDLAQAAGEAPAPTRIAPVQAQAKPRSINDILAMTEGGGVPLN
ncbi:cell wall hydrolase [Segnochrobactrum spirostomi]|nr:cell wall hydrolase [Segnochrobactrum spirostomi]